MLSLKYKTISSSCACLLVSSLLILGNSQLSAAKNVEISCPKKNKIKCDSTTEKCTSDAKTFHWTGQGKAPTKNDHTLSVTSTELICEYDSGLKLKMGYLGVYAHCEIDPVKKRFDCSN